MTVKEIVFKLNQKLLKIESFKKRQELLIQHKEEIKHHIIDGKIYLDERDYTLYSIIQIGDYCWLGENMRFEISDKSFSPNESPEYLLEHGRLYYLEGAMEACPPGFIIPDAKIWSDVLLKAGGYKEAYSELNYGEKPMEAKAALAKGGKLQLDLSFSGIGGKYRFSDQDVYGYYWTSSNKTGKEIDSTVVCLANDYDDVNTNEYENITGEAYSCRYVLNNVPKYKVQELNKTLLSIKSIEKRISYLENLNENLTAFIHSEHVFIDKRDYTLYTVLHIGNQKWLGENIRYKLDSDCFTFQTHEKELYKQGCLYESIAAYSAIPEGCRLPKLEDWNEFLTTIDGTIENKTITIHKKTYFEIINGGNSGIDLCFTGTVDMKSPSDHLMPRQGFYLTASQNKFSNNYYLVLTDSNSFILSEIDEEHNNMATALRCLLK